jgi:Zn-dependent protease with chaperone function
MFKKRNISVYSDLKTGFFCKFLLILGIVLLIFYILQKTIFLVDIDENIVGSLLAFAILSLGLGFILYFLSRQFAKLAKIAEEIEKENVTEDTENTK